MKKSLIALAVAAFAASSVSAAQIYNKDDTTINMTGRIHVYWTNGDNSPVANHDATIRNSARLGFNGRTKLTDGIYGFAATEWDMSDADGRNSVGARDQFVGVDFGQFGQVKMGRYKDPINAITDIASDVMPNLGEALFPQERRAGQLTYSWSGYGVNAVLSYQSAKDRQEVGIINADIESGFTAVLGYTSPAVGFGPIKVQAAYSYIKGQDDHSALSAEFKGWPLGKLDKSKTWGASLSWGNQNKGAYVVAAYANTDYSFEDDVTDFDYKQLELFASYRLDCGVKFMLGYNWEKYDPDNGSSASTKAVLAAVDYYINPFFDVYIDAAFDASSDKDSVIKTLRGGSNYDNNRVTIGARWTF